MWRSLVSELKVWPLSQRALQRATKFVSARPPRFKAEGHGLWLATRVELRGGAGEPPGLDRVGGRVRGGGAHGGDEGGGAEHCERAAAGLERHAPSCST